MDSVPDHGKKENDAIKQVLIFLVVEGLVFNLHDMQYL